MRNKATLFIFLAFMLIAIAALGLKSSAKTLGIYLEEPKILLDRTQEDKTSVEKDFSEEWLSLLSLKEICPEIYIKDASLAKIDAWRELPLNMSTPQIKSEKKPMQWPKTYWDGRDFREEFPVAK